MAGYLVPSPAAEPSVQRSQCRPTRWYVKIAANVGQFTNSGSPPEAHSNSWRASRSGKPGKQGCVDSSSVRPAICFLRERRRIR